MNHLAHVFLSLEDEDLLLGNFMGDYIKNRELPRFSEGVQKGVFLHRFIDTYSDSHPVFRRSTARLHPRQGKYSPVVVDLFYDHFLSIHWKKYHPESLEVTASNTYKLLGRKLDLLPERLQVRLPRMIEVRFLERYLDLDQMGSAFSFLAKRTRFDSNISQAHLDLERDYDKFEADFLDFFPEIISKVADWKRINLQNEVRS